MNLEEFDISVKAINAATSKDAKRQLKLQIADIKRRVAKIKEEVCSLKVAEDNVKRELAKYQLALRQANSAVSYKGKMLSVNLTRRGGSYSRGEISILGDLNNSVRFYRHYHIYENNTWLYVSHQDFQKAMISVGAPLKSANVYERKAEFAPFIQRVYAACRFIAGELTRDQFLASMCVGMEQYLPSDTYEEIKGVL